MESTVENKFYVPALGYPRAYDRAALKHHLVFGTLDDLSHLPPEGLSRRPKFPIKDQKDTNFCTPAATSAASEYQEDVALSMEWQAAKVGQLTGSPITGGADAKVALKAAVLFGSLPVHEMPAGYSLAEKLQELGEDQYVLDATGSHVGKKGGAAFLADWTNWPEYLDDKARPYRKQSYFDATTGPHDIFDNLRVALFLAQHDNGVCIATTQWDAAWNAPKSGIMPHRASPYGWHDWVIIDFTNQAGTEYLVCQNSYGTAFGDNGLFYLDRENTNSSFATPGSGASIFRAMHPSDAKAIQAQQQATMGILFDALVRIGVPVPLAYKLLTIIFHQ